MHTYQPYYDTLGPCDLASMLEELQGVCDPEFDAITEELERQFQEMRFSNGQA